MQTQRFAKPKTDAMLHLKPVAEQLMSDFLKAERGRNYGACGNEIADEIGLAFREEWRRQFLRAYRQNPDEARAARRRLKRKSLLDFLKETGKSASPITPPRLYAIDGGRI